MAKITSPTINVAVLNINDRIVHFDRSVAIYLLSTYPRIALLISITNHISELKYWPGAFIAFVFFIPVVYGAPTGTLDPEVSKFSANNMSLVIGDYDSRIIGKFKNIDNQTLYLSDVIIDSYDSNSNLISVDKGSPSYASLGPGQTTSFEVDIDVSTAKKLDHFVVGLPSNEEEPTSLFDLPNILNQSSTG